MTRLLLPTLLLVAAAALLLAGPLPGHAGGAHGSPGAGGPTWGKPYAWGHKTWRGWPRAWWGPNGWEPWTPAVQLPEPSFRPWYYCPEARDFFPFVLDCPAGWIQVLPEQAR